jgi:hypothetical protein
MGIPGIVCSVDMSVLDTFAKQPFQGDRSHATGREEGAQGSNEDSSTKQGTNDKTHLGRGSHA